MLKNSDFELMDPLRMTPNVAILIPCHNEEATIASVVREFQQELPDAKIYVCDNNSTDHTATEAQEAGAIVLHEKRKGKGYAVQTMFRKIDADVYVIVDGDGTYPAKFVHELMEPLLKDEADMVVGSRLHKQSNSTFKPLNRFGNLAFLNILNWTFKVHLTDILSGYRAFSRKFVKGIPLFGGGFEIETELTIKCLERGYRIVELPVHLISRIEGSQSKVRIARDGIIILHTILALFRDYKPLTFFGGTGIFVALSGAVIAVLLVFKNAIVQAGLRTPLSIVSAALILCGMLLFIVGLILHTIVRRFQELDHQLRVLTEDSSRNTNDKLRST